MAVVRLASETDFSGWREAARRLRALGVAPDAVLWTVDRADELFDDGPVATPVTGTTFTVPKDFLALADAAILHRSDERFSLLYRLLWRLAREPHLLRLHADSDVQKARGFARAVAQAEHRMKAFVRFRLIVLKNAAFRRDRA
ncbi:DUF4130 domain-containing protein [Phenylobacterium sp.]|uniref:DUF4130 domain-containing protein n=1 Tax=Phenylobacterium sp. TaxID=1871053 RepID=UPI00286BF228|nr:DUF4130 domain-containing protein [Phenylobacterium sp.]